MNSMTTKRIKFTFFILGTIIIFYLGMSWLFLKVFGEVHSSELIYYIEAVCSLIAYDKKILEYVIQWISICLAADIL